MANLPEGSTVAGRVAAATASLSPAELRVAWFLVRHREEAVLASAASIAKRTGVSDATVVRAVRNLGYAGLDAMRRDLVAELRVEHTPASRVALTLDEAAGDPGGALEATLRLHTEKIDALRHAVTGPEFAEATRQIRQAKRVAVFGIGPSGAIATYFAIQARRLGLDAITLRETGLLLADDLLRLRSGDMVLVMAYGRVYPEVEAVLACAGGLGLTRVLVTDSLATALGGRVDLVLNVPRGRVDAFSMHTATLAFLEALLVGLAAEQPGRAIASLERLNGLRAGLAGDRMRLESS